MKKLDTDRNGSAVFGLQVLRCVPTTEPDTYAVTYRLGTEGMYDTVIVSAVSPGAAVGSVAMVEYFTALRDRPFDGTTHGTGGA